MPVSAPSLGTVSDEMRATDSTTGEPVGFFGSLWSELAEHPQWIHQPDHRPREVVHPVNRIEPGHHLNPSELGPHDRSVVIKQVSGERLLHNSPIHV